MSKRFLLFLIILNINYYYAKEKINSLSHDNYKINYSPHNLVNNIHITEKRIPIGKIILFLLIIILFFIIFTSIKNTKIMNKTLEEGFTIIKKNLKLKEQNPGEFNKIIIKGFIPFYISLYKIEGFGNLSLMTVNIGIMQMITLTMSPFEKDIPLISIDYIYMFNIRKAMIEIYDLMIDNQNIKYKNLISKFEKINENYSDLQKFKTLPGWYEKILSICILRSCNSINDERIISLFKNCIEVYIQNIIEMPQLNDSDIQKKYSLIKQFGNDLVDKGGVAVNNFKKSIGNEKTKEFFAKVFFGYENKINMDKDMKIKKE